MTEKHNAPEPEEQKEDQFAEHLADPNDGEDIVTDDDFEDEDDEDLDEDDLLDEDDE